MGDANRQILAATLDWYLAMGVDGAVTDDPICWLNEKRGPPGSGFALAGEPAANAEPLVDPQSRRLAAAGSAPHIPAAKAPADASPRRFATAAPDVAVGAARTAARKAANLAELRAALQAFEGCSLKATAKNLCFFRGAERAPLMIIGEAPGRDEDLEGRPFVGRAGQLLDQMLMAAGLSESDVHITNIVYWRPPGNRTPTPQEAEVCRPFLERQIELVAPRVLLLLGGAATKQILQTDEGILKARGRWTRLTLAGREFATIASLHPAYVLRTPISKRQAWRDFLSVKEALIADRS